MEYRVASDEFRKSKHEVVMFAFRNSKLVTRNSISLRYEKTLTPTIPATIIIRQNILPSVTLS